MLKLYDEGGEGRGVPAQLSVGHNRGRRGTNHRTVFRNSVGEIVDGSARKAVGSAGRTVGSTRQTAGSARKTAFVARGSAGHSTDTSSGYSSGERNSARAVAALSSEVSGFWSRSTSSRRLAGGGDGGGGGAKKGFVFSIEEMTGEVTGTGGVEGSEKRGARARRGTGETMTNFSAARGSAASAEETKNVSGRGGGSGGPLSRLLPAPAGFLSDEGVEGGGGRKAAAVQSTPSRKKKVRVFFCFCFLGEGASFLSCWFCCSRGSGSGWCLLCVKPKGVCYANWVVGWVERRGGVMHGVRAKAVVGGGGTGSPRWLLWPRLSSGTEEPLGDLGKECGRVCAPFRGGRPSSRTGVLRVLCVLSLTRVSRAKTHAHGLSRLSPKNNTLQSCPFLFCFLLHSSRTFISRRSFTD